MLSSILCAGLGRLLRWAGGLGAGQLLRPEVRGACASQYLWPMNSETNLPAPATSTDLETRIRRKLLGQGFMHLIGADLTVITPGRVEAELTIASQHLQQHGFTHGGLIATLADLVAGFAAVTLVPEGVGVVTSDLKISYLHPGVGQRLRAIGWVLKPGRRLHFCEAEVWCDELMIAKASATMAVIEPQ